jgi:hypothetical protein
MRRDAAPLGLEPGVKIRESLPNRRSFHVVSEDAGPAATHDGRIAMKYGSEMVLNARMCT